MRKKIIFRCDAGTISELGTGHLQRCITLSILLKKRFCLKKKDILFLIKTKDKHSISKKILNKNNFKFVSINNKIKDYSENEINLINNYKSNLIVIDRLGSINKKFIYDLKKNHKKILLFDDSSCNRDLVDLAINSLILNVKKSKKTLTGHQFNIVPGFLANKEKKSRYKRSQTIFISFGGYDKNNLTVKLVKNLLKSKINFNLFLNKKYKNLYKNNKKIRFYNSKNYYKNLILSNLVISAGGLTMFDAIYFNKTIISIPQYKHQLRNINILSKKKVVYKLNINNITKINFLLNNINQKKFYQIGNNSILNSKLINKTLNKIYKQYEEN